MTCKVLVLGSTGFVGTHVYNQAKEKFGEDQLVGTSQTLGVDLTSEDQTLKLFAKIRPEYVINCSAFVGGIQFGYKFPADLYAKNTRMSLNILDACLSSGVRRLVNPISNCAYPAKASLFREEEFWDGPLHESVLAYGFARKSSWVGSWAYAKQHGLDVLNLIVSNMYGPGDHFQAERSHALGALIQRIHMAKLENCSEVVVWGTGSPVREWLYVEDGAKALLAGLSCDSCLDIVNVGIGAGVSVKVLAEKIALGLGYQGKLVFDSSKPDGAPYKTVEGSKGKALLGFAPQIDLDTGIPLTID